MEVSSWENHLFLWAIYTMAMLNNQRVNIYVLTRVVMVSHTSRNDRPNFINIPSTNSSAIMAARNLKKKTQKESLYQDCIFIHQSHKIIPSAYLWFCQLNLKFCWFNLRFLSILIYSWWFSHSSQVNHTIAIQSIVLDIPRLHSGWLSAQHPHVDSGWSC